MAQIKHLSDEVINQIAAGEVVERPASVVKELVENALDADADRIEIYLEEGGKSLIRVVDNGVGMSKEDLVHAVTRHWTSKIALSEDLFNINTLGFRGEALASIAAVSKFSLASRTVESDSGWKQSTPGKVPNLTSKKSDFAAGGSTRNNTSTDPDVGKVLNLTLSEVGMPVGTEVTVRDLFYNVPARKNFLKHERTEFAHTAELIYQLALVHPQVAFVLYHNEKKVFQSTGGGKTDTGVVAKILGNELASRLLPVRGEHPQARVTGWIGRPGMGAARRAKQYVFINGRPVENRLIWSAVNAAYGSLIGRHEKPQYALMIEIAPHLVDVNVHPQKKEIRFAVGDTVFRLVRDAVYSALTGVAVQRERRVASEEFAPDIGRISPIRPITPLSGYKRSLESGTGFIHESVPLGYEEERFVSPTSAKAFQVLNLFLIEEVENGIRVYDQHAVHERVLYNGFAHAFLAEKEKPAAQSLLIPVEIELSPTEVAVWEESRETLTRLGFATKQLSGSTLQITQVPAALAGISLHEIFLEVLSDLSDLPELSASPVKQIDDQTHRRLSYLACRSAVKAGDRLNEAEAAALLTKFRQAEFSSTCPHGRPVMVEIGRREMEKWFRR